jgi:hypothetical protein
VSTYTAHVVYSAAFERVHTWCLWADGRTVRVRFRQASGPEHVTELPIAALRWRDEDTFSAGPASVDGVDGKVVFHLRGAPESVTEEIRRVASATR